MRIGYLECFAGVSGDMLMAALVDAGAPFEQLQQAARSLGLGAELALSHVNRSGIYSTKIDVTVGGELVEPAAPTGPREGHAHDHPYAHDHQHEHDNHGHHGQHSHTHEHDGHGNGHSHGHEFEHSHQHSHQHGPGHAHSHTGDRGHGHAHGRTLAEIRSILDAATLPEAARSLAISAFELLADAEAHIHGTTPDKVHFHEVGGVDAIVDITCSAVAATALDVDGWYCTPVNVGSGFVNCAHGRFPVPSPAAAELLKGVPTYSAGVEMELVTPTGAALIRALGCSFAATPVLRAERIGYGAGTRNPAKFPNVLRVTVATAESAPRATISSGSEPGDTVTVLECAIDDLSPEVLAHAAQLALDAGALDVTRTALTMKKGRAGTLLTVLCRPADAPRMQQLLFRHTSTLGLRVREERRMVLARDSVSVQTEFGPIRIKVGSYQGEETNAAPEFEDCRLAAASADVPLKIVMEAALAAYRKLHSARSTSPASAAQ